MSAGCRALTSEEVQELRNYFESRIGGESDKFDLVTRNLSLIFFSLYTGFRISETLSLTVEDVYQFDHVTDSVYLKKCNTKKQVAGRTGVLNAKCQEILKHYLLHYSMTNATTLISRPLFFSRKGGALGVWAAHKIFTDAFDAIELSGKMGTHVTRKTFASNVYKLVDRNIIDLQQAMGHQSIGSTQKYISADNEKVQSALLALDF